MKVSSITGPTEILSACERRESGDCGCPFSFFRLFDCLHLSPVFAIGVCQRHILQLSRHRTAAVLSGYFLVLVFMYALNNDGCNKTSLPGIHSTMMLFSRRSGRTRRSYIPGSSRVRRSGMNLLSPTMVILAASVSKLSRFKSIRPGSGRPCWRTLPPE